jgi:amidase
MQRRNFLRTGSLAALTLSSLVGSTATASPSSTLQSTPEEALSIDPNDFELNEVTIAELQKKMQDKVYTSRSITELYLKRIAELDKKGPELNAVIELNKEALKIADELDQERSRGQVRGPMHGIPVLIKDNINTGDGMRTSAGSLALNDNQVKEDAFIVKQLRAAGAVIIGKTNLSEWANFRSTHSTSAWSSRGGQTKHPYILDRNPSGSSAGSGTAVAANLCAVGIGTETDGSVVSPASVSGLVGLKPTIGLLSRTGIIPISITQDTAGPMARTVSDAAILLAALVGADPQDSYTHSSIGKFKKDYTSYLDADGLKGKRLGLEKSALKQGNAAMLKLLNSAIETMRSKGAIITEVELYKELNAQGDAEFTVLLYEFKDGLNKYLSKANSKMKNLADVIAYNKQHEEKAMPFFKQETLELAEKKGGLNSKEYLDALKKSHTGSRLAINKIITTNHLDAIIGPTNGFAVCIDLVNGDYDNGFSFSSPAAKAGYPHITVPMGSWKELPMGLSFFGLPYTEPELLKLAYAYEHASKKRLPPKFIPTLLG